jgi:hypothetical protein
MAKFISLNSSAAALNAGELLVSSEAIVFVAQTAATTTLIYLDGSAAANDLITITHTTTGTDPSMREAINYALTANPGGVKAKVQLPAGITISVIAIS